MNKIILVFVAIFLMCCCQPVTTQEDYSATTKQKLAPKSADTTTSHVIHYDGETEKYSIERWLWNVMSGHRISYQSQLKAAELYLLMNKHINCYPLRAEEEE